MCLNLSHFGQACDSLWLHTIVVVLALSGFPFRISKQASYISRPVYKAKSPSTNHCIGEILDLNFSKGKNNFLFWCIL